MSGMIWKIPLFKIYWDEDNLKVVSKVIKRELQWVAGPEIREFEKIMAGNNLTYPL